MSPQLKSPRVRPPLDETGLKEVALRYVAKYATTRAKLRTYLARKIRERGWEGERQPDLEELADRFAELGFIDDAAFAMSKSRALVGRGYGKQRLADQLRRAGVAEEDRREALGAAEGQALKAALRFAERRRIGPFSSKAADLKTRQRALAAMVRAGHDLALARKIIGMEPGSAGNLPNLCESCPFDAA